MFLEEKNWKYCQATRELEAYVINTVNLHSYSRHMLLSDATTDFDWLPLKRKHTQTYRHRTHAHVCILFFSKKILQKEVISNAHAHVCILLFFKKNLSARKNVTWFKSQWLGSYRRALSLEHRSRSAVLISRLKNTVS
jgi:hypothetical protein